MRRVHIPGVADGGMLRASSYLILALVPVLIVTLTPNLVAGDDQRRQASLVPFHHVSSVVRGMVRDGYPLGAARATLVDLFGNIGLFVPLGAVAGAALARTRHATWRQIAIVLGGGLLLSVLIEATQFWLPTRYADVDDVIFNGGGTLLGAMAALALRAVRGYRVRSIRLLDPVPRARRLVGAAALLLRRRALPRHTQVPGSTF